MQGHLWERIFQPCRNVVKNHESFTLKQMFDVTAQLVNNQEEISCLDKIMYGKNSWTHLFLINDAESHQFSKHQGLRIFGFCIVSRQNSSTS